MREEESAKDELACPGGQNSSNKSHNMTSACHIIAKYIAKCKNNCKRSGKDMNEDDDEEKDEKRKIRRIWKTADNRQTKMAQVVSSTSFFLTYRSLILWQGMDLGFQTQGKSLCRNLWDAAKKWRTPCIGYPLKDLVPTNKKMQRGPGGKKKKKKPHHSARK